MEVYVENKKSRSIFVRRSLGIMRFVRKVEEINNNKQKICARK